MIIEVRKTLTGTEYWDTEEKRTLFVPKGKEPEVEVDSTEIDTETDITLDNMNAEQLLSFAEQNGIDVPGNMKKEETIRKYIAEQLAADEK